MNDKFSKIVVNAGNAPQIMRGVTGNSEKGDAE